MRYPRIKIKKISLRITLYFSSLLLMIALVVTFLNITLYSREVSEQIDNVTEQKLSLITGRLNENISNIRQIHSILISNTSVQSAFEKVVNDPTDANINLLSTILESHRRNTPAKYIIALGLEGEIYDPISSFPAYQQLTHGNSDFELSVKEQQYQRFTVPNTFPLEYASPTPVQRNNITLYAQYYNYDTITQLGYLAINFNKAELFSTIEPLAKDTFASLYIVDEQDNLVYEVGDIPFNSLPSNYDNDTILEIDEATYNLRKASLSSYERWHLVTLFDRDLMTIQTNRLNRYIYLTLAIAMLLMFLFSWFISQNITNPIRQVVTSMGVFERGQWPEPLVTNNSDEIKDLIDGYNNMLNSFIKLTDDMLGKQQESQITEINLIKTQLHLLEAQINPHFIHNTLNSMNYLALSQGNEDLSALIGSFNKLLRTSMAIDVSFVNVSQEIDNIKDYARIQNVRFENAFVIDYIIDPEAAFGKIPKLILQPIVENAIIHGILPKDEIGHILIAIRKKANMLMITITDDGVGMEDMQLEDILNTDHKGLVSKHIGVQNVFDRLRLYYGEGIDLSMKSKLGIGTTIILMIPYED